MIFSVVKVEKLELACDAGGKESGKPWFVGKDVAEMLGYKKSRNALTAHVDGEDKKDALIQGPLGGLYSLVLASKPKVWG